MPVLPSAAVNHMSNTANLHLREGAHLPIETFTVLYYGDTQAEAFLGEIDKDTWIERVDGDTFTYQEVSESDDLVVLYDASRDRTVTIDWPNYDLTVSDNGTNVTYEVIDFSNSLSPYMPQDFSV
jgi:hypothetical protein